MQVYNINSVWKGNNPVSRVLFEENRLQGRAVTFLVRHRKEKKEVVGETNKIVWSQLVELLLALEAMEIEQTGRDNILYLQYWTQWFCSLSPFSEAVRFRLFVS